VAQSLLALRRLEGPLGLQKRNGPYKANEKAGHSVVLHDKLKPIVGAPYERGEYQAIAVGPSRASGPDIVSMHLHLDVSSPGWNFAPPLLRAGAPGGPISTTSAATARCNARMPSSLINGNGIASRIVSAHSGRAAAKPGS
jgi:hypothetical protein